MIHYAFQLCRALAEAGVAVVLYTDQSYELEAMEAPFRVVKLLRLWDSKPLEGPHGRRWQRLRRIGRGLRYYREWWRLVVRLRRDRPDVVQLGDIRFPGDLVFLWLLRFSGLRLVDICHNVEPFRLAGRAAGGFRASRRIRWLYRQIYKCFERVFVHYSGNRERFIAVYGNEPRRVVAIPHGNETLFSELRGAGESAAKLRLELEFPPEAKTVLLFGTLSWYKGADLLLAAFSKLHRAVPEARLVYAGYPLEDFDLAGLRREVERRGLVEKVRIVPRYIENSEVAAWMELATVAVFPYREISQSGALLVALTFGVPSVVTRVGAMTEAVTNGETALLVRPDDPDELAQALARLLTDEELRLRLGAAARRYALGTASWKAVAARLHREYLNLCAPEEIHSDLPRARLEQR